MDNELHTLEIPQKKNYFQTNFMLYRNMSKRQRTHLIFERVHIPKHLRQPITDGATPLICEFNEKASQMAAGKIPFDTGVLVEMLDRIDRARWATPPR